MTATTDNRELRALVQEIEAAQHRPGGFICDRVWIDRIRALLTRTEADEAAPVADGAVDLYGPLTGAQEASMREHCMTHLHTVDVEYPDTGKFIRDWLTHVESERNRLFDALRAHPQDASAGAIPEAVAVQPSGYMVGSGFVAKGDYVIPTAHGVRVVNAEFARGWNEARAALEAAVGDMVLVPRYLTDEMRDAMHEAGYSYDEKWDGALLAAANGEGENHG